MRIFLKRFFIIFTISFLLVKLIYVCNIDNLPDNIVLFEGEKLSLNTVFGINIETEFSSNPNIERINNNETITVSTNIDNIEEIDCTGTVYLSVNFLGFKVKEINVDVIEETEVVPMGNVIGVKLYTNGVLVVGMSEISGSDSNKYKPYEGAGIEEGDVIVEIDESIVTSTNELLEAINKSSGKDMNVKYIRDR